MLYKDLFFSIHWLAVAVVTLASLGVTFGWTFLWARRGYGAESGQAVPPARTQTKPLYVLIISALHLIAFANLSLVVAGQGWRQGLVTGLAISLVWVLPALATSNLHAGRSWRFLTLDTGLYVLLYSIGGLVLGIW